jgi:hypothetical protein
MGKRYHSEFSESNHSTQFITNRENISKHDPYSYPIYRIYHYPIYWLLLTGKSLCGKGAGARIVTDQETEDLRSELPSRIAVLLAI